MAIPLRNVYYLLCYAWRRLPARDLVAASTDLGDRVENLFAHVLAEGVSTLLRQGLDHGFVGHELELRGIRGKLLVGDSVKRLLLPAGRAACQVDELTVDVPHNRVIKAAIQWLARCEAVHAELRGRLYRHLPSFAQVSDAALEPSLFRGVQLHRNIARYGFLLRVCELLMRCWVPDPSTGQRTFHPFTASDSEMGKLFEEFLRGFFELEQRELAVSRPKLTWGASASDATHLEWLPEMRTDVVLTSVNRRIVIESKFYKSPTATRFAGGQPKLLSDHLYQLLAYLRHADVPGQPQPGGMLLYASPGDGFDLSYTLEGYPVRVVTLDLAQPWRVIKQSLLDLIEQDGPR